MTLTGSWERLSLRARLLVIGVLGVAVALAIGSFALYGVLTLVSFRTIDDAGQAIRHRQDEQAHAGDEHHRAHRRLENGNQVVQMYRGCAHAG